jgi:hypothetical protein
MHPVEIFWTITIGHNPRRPAAVFGPSKEKLPASFAGNKENQVWRTAQGKGGVPPQLEMERGVLPLKITENV